MCRSVTGGPAKTPTCSSGPERGGPAGPSQCGPEADLAGADLTGVCLGEDWVISWHARNGRRNAVSEHGAGQPCRPSPATALRSRYFGAMGAKHTPPADRHGHGGHNPKITGNLDGHGHRDGSETLCKQGPGVRFPDSLKFQGSAACRSSPLREPSGSQRLTGARHSNREPPPAMAARRSSVVRPASRWERLVVRHRSLEEVPRSCGRPWCARGLWRYGKSYPDSQVGELVAPLGSSAYSPSAIPNTS